MINVTGLTKHYGERRAVDDLSFELEAGRVTASSAPTAPANRPPCG
jgi:ABC-type Na+ transport system ATPase subunit NatA